METEFSAAISPWLNGATPLELSQVSESSRHARESISEGCFGLARSRTSWCLSANLAVSNLPLVVGWSRHRLFDFRYPKLKAPVLITAHSSWITCLFAPHLCLRPFGFSFLFCHHLFSYDRRPLRLSLQAILDQIQHQEAFCLAPSLPLVMELDQRPHGSSRSSYSANYRSFHILSTFCSLARITFQWHQQWTLDLMKTR